MLCKWSRKDIESLEGQIKPLIRLRQHELMNLQVSIINGQYKTCNDSSVYRASLFDPIEKNLVVKDNKVEVRFDWMLYLIINIMKLIIKVDNRKISNNNVINYDKYVCPFWIYFEMWYWKVVSPKKFLTMKINSFIVYYYTLSRNRLDYRSKYSSRVIILIINQWQQYSKTWSLSPTEC